MAFEGSLDAFGLPNVLRLLAATAKTGCLYIEGDRGRGSVGVHEGDLVAASADVAPERAPLDGVVFELMRFRRGSFRFAVDDQPWNGDEEPLEMESVLGQAEQLLEEWQDLEAVVPSPGHRIDLVRELEDEEVTVDARLWPALVAAARGGTLGDLAAALGLGELDTARLVRELVDLGVAIVQPPDEGRTWPAGRRARGPRATGERAATAATAAS